MCRCDCNSSVLRLFDVLSVQTERIHQNLFCDSVSAHVSQSTLISSFPLAAISAADHLSSRRLSLDTQQLPSVNLCICCASVCLRLFDAPADVNDIRRQMKSKFNKKLIDGCRVSHSGCMCISQPNGLWAQACVH